MLDFIKINKAKIVNVHWFLFSAFADFPAGMILHDVVVVAARDDLAAAAISRSLSTLSFSSFWAFSRASFRFADLSRLI